MNHWNVILTGNTHFSVCIICVKNVSLPVYSGEYLDQSDKLGFFSISWIMFGSCEIPCSMDSPWLPLFFFWTLDSFFSLYFRLPLTFGSQPPWSWIRSRVLQVHPVCHQQPLPHSYVCCSHQPSLPPRGQTGSSCDPDKSSWWGQCQPQRGTSWQGLPRDLNSRSRAPHLGRWIQQQVVAKRS